MTCHIIALAGTIAAILFRAQAAAISRAAVNIAIKAGCLAEIRPMPIPEDYVDAAENVMRKILSNRSRITTTKMRGFLTLVNDIYNVESLRFDEKISPESKLKIMRLRVRMVYDAGRELDVKTFIEKARLLEYLKGVGDNREC